MLPLGALTEEHYEVVIGAFLTMRARMPTGSATLELPIAAAETVKQVSHGSGGARQTLFV
jgi:hypothetical protein